MKLYSYVITRDFGFAPNPYFGLCTLATCKPVIRRKCNIGDWVAGFGGSATPVHRKLVYLMKVTETLTFNQYWNAPRFEKKKPCFNKSIKYCYGDNIYHHEDGQAWRQEFSHHSYEDGVNQINLERDTQTDRVLISDYFWYFGNRAVLLEDELSSFIAAGRGHHVFSGEESEFFIEKVTNYLSASYEMGISGMPFSQKGEFIQYRGERR